MIYTASGIETATATVGERMCQLMEELYPICRSITGNGVRETLNILKRDIPLTIYEVPTGTRVFDWEVPKEWNIRDAWIKNSNGDVIVDFKNSNLHVLNYSVPVHRKVSLQELKQHLYFLPERPDDIPYRTSYYKEDWGFCMTYNQFRELQEDLYEVFIDATLEEGSLTYAEFYLPGELHDEVLITTHICHPSLCNDNLSGISVVSFLARELMNFRLRYSYRILFIPGTIGAITWLALNESRVNSIRHGMIASLLGDEGNFTYKRSRKGNAEIDQIVEYILKRKDPAGNVIDFVPYGYDERQFCSPAFDLPMGCFTRSTYGQYPQYHTSADDLSFVKAHALEGSLHAFLQIIDMLETNKWFVNQNPKCEPQLGKRGLYDLKGGTSEKNDFQLALLWVLNFSDGRHSLLDISKRSNMSFELIREAAYQLVACGLLKEACMSEQGQRILEDTINFQ